MKFWGQLFSWRLLFLFFTNFNCFNYSCFGVLSSSRFFDESTCNCTSSVFLFVIISPPNIKDIDFCIYLMRLQFLSCPLMANVIPYIVLDINKYLTYCISFIMPRKVRNMHISLTYSQGLIVL